MTGPGGTQLTLRFSATIIRPVPHVYRIEWTATDVKFYVDGTLDRHARGDDRRADAPGRQ